jgi:hypothetical protein
MTVLTVSRDGSRPVSEAFPSLEIVLQGAAVTGDLVRTTFVSKSGITSTTFKTISDARLRALNCCSGKQRKQ